MGSKDLGQLFKDFCETVAKLRHPEDGCPWDLEQTHSSLRRYMIEEAYEAAEQMERCSDGKASAADEAELADELGDVLLQVVLNAQLASERNAFRIADAVQAINEKMLRRHPHVFADDAKERSFSKAEWERIKAEEKAKKELDQNDKGYFAKVPKGFPATTQAKKIGKLAAKINFDWDDTQEVVQSFLSEVDELKEALQASSFQDDAEVRAEISDVYFSLAQVCRHLSIDPEEISLDGNRKFLHRFAKLESLAQKAKIDVESATRDTLERLWNEAKSSQSWGQSLDCPPGGQSRD